MISRTVYMAQADENGNFAHILTRNVLGDLRCHCDSRLKVFKRKTCECPFTQELSCKVCDEERQKWQKFWNTLSRAEGTDEGPKAA